MLGLTPNEEIGFFGVFVGAFVTLGGETVRGVLKDRRTRMTILRGLRRSLSNLLTLEAPYQKALSEARSGKPVIPNWDRPIIAPYLDEALALTAAEKRSRNLYHALVEVKRGLDSINQYLQQTPMIQTSSWITAQPIDTQMSMFVATFEIAERFYHHQVREPSALALKFLLPETDRFVVWGQRRFEHWPNIVRWFVYWQLRFDGSSKEEAWKSIEQSEKAVSAAKNEQSPTAPYARSYHPDVSGHLVPDEWDESATPPTSNSWVEENRRKR